MTAVLCLSLAVPAELVAKVAGAGRAREAKESTGAVLNAEQRVEHALNRFTFGPMPGEVAAVQRQGLDAWFERQLHPEQIDDTVLEGRLREFPALQMTPEELLRRFPSPARLRADEKRGVPGEGSLQAQGPVERAVYADASAAYAARKQAQAGLANSGGEAAGSMAGQPATGPDAGRNRASAADRDGRKRSGREHEAEHGREQFSRGDRDAGEGEGCRAAAEPPRPGCRDERGRGAGRVGADAK